MKKRLLVQKLHEDAVIPQRATPGSAGYDLCACLSQEVVIKPGETMKIPTGIALGFETEEYAAFIYARSGLSTKYAVAPANCVGVIDSDYRGEILVPLRNDGKAPFVVHPGDRIAQMVITRVETPELLQTDHLDETKRGSGGFGSTSV